MEVTFVRHGESLANIGQSKDPDSVLTPRGEAQADLTALRLAGDARRLGSFSRAFISPFRRTLLTFRPIQRELGVPAEIDPEICEYFHEKTDWYRTFVGITEDEIRREFPDIDTRAAFAANARWWPSPLEDTHAVRARAARVASDLRAAYGATDSRLLIVSHAETIGRMVEALMGWDHADEAPWTNNCAIWRIAAGSEPGDARLILRNSHEHLAILELTGAAAS